MTWETGGAGGIVCEYDWADIEPSVAIIEAIHDLESASQPVVREPFPDVLGDYLDTDALDALVSGPSPVTVSFTFGSYHVTVTGTTVHITPAEAPALCQ